MNEPKHTYSEQDYKQVRDSIKVIGIGGQGASIVNAMYVRNSTLCRFTVLDEDKNALAGLSVPQKIQVEETMDAVDTIFDKLISDVEEVILVSVIGGAVSSAYSSALCKYTVKHGKKVRAYLASSPDKSERETAAMCFMEIESHAGFVQTIDSGMLIHSFRYRPKDTVIMECIKDILSETVNYAVEDMVRILIKFKRISDLLDKL